MKLQPEERRAFNKVLGVSVPTALFLAGCIVISVDRLLHWNELELGEKIVLPLLLFLCGGVLIALLFVLSAPLLARFPNPFLRRRSNRSRYVPAEDGDMSVAPPAGQFPMDTTEDRLTDVPSVLEEDEQAALAHLDERTRRLLVLALPLGMSEEFDLERIDDYGIVTDSDLLRIARHDYFGTVTTEFTGCDGFTESLHFQKAGLFDFHCVPAGDGFAVRFLYEPGDDDRSDRSPILVGFTCSGISCRFDPEDLRPVLMDGDWKPLSRILSVLRDISLKSAILGKEVLLPEEEELLGSLNFVALLDHYRMRQLDLSDVKELDTTLAFLAGRHAALHAAFQSYRDGLSPDGRRPSRAVRRELDRELAGFMDSLDAQPLLLDLARRIDEIMVKFSSPVATRIPGLEGLKAAMDDFLQQKGFTGAYPDYRRNRKGGKDSVTLGFYPNFGSSSSYHAIGIRAGIRNRRDELSHVCLFIGNRFLQTDLGDFCDPASDEAVRGRVAQVLPDRLNISRSSSDKLILDDGKAFAPMTRSGWT